MRRSVVSPFLIALLSISIARCAEDSRNEKTSAESAPTSDDYEENGSLGLVDGSGKPIYGLRIAKFPNSEAGSIQTTISTWCGKFCAGLYSLNSLQMMKDTPVVLEAQALPGYTFTRWEGQCTSGSPSNICNTMMTDATADTLYTAVFTPIDPVAVNITIDSETTLGQVQGIRSDLNCSKSVGSVCTVALARDTTLLLRANDQSNDVMFVGWNGLNCLRKVSSGRSHLCEVRLDAPINFSAKFVKAATLTATSVLVGLGDANQNKIRSNQGVLYTQYVVGADAGSILGGVLGRGGISTTPKQKGGPPTNYSGFLEELDIDRPSWENLPTSSYFAKFRLGTAVTLTVDMLAGLTYGGWELDCLSAKANTSCTITLDQNKTVRAKFLNPPPPTPCNYTATKSGVFYYGVENSLSIRPASSCLAKTISLRVTKGCTHQLIGSTLNPVAPVAEIPGSRAVLDAATSVIRYSVKGTEGVVLTDGTVKIKGDYKAGATPTCKLLGVDVK